MACRSTLAYIVGVLVGGGFGFLIGRFVRVPRRGEMMFERFKALFKKKEAVAEQEKAEERGVGVEE